MKENTCRVVGRFLSYYREKGKRSGYGYEYEQAVAGTGLGMPIVKNSLM